MIKNALDYNEDFRLDWHDPDEATDGYQLKWIGKDYARLQAGTATETVIIPDNEHNQKEENKNSQNLFFTGDNLEVLKHLQNAYSNSIKMIYIDPPYNTGNEFLYNDSFEFSDEKLKDMLGMTDEEIKRLHTINGKSSHSAWLTFMYPRLKVAKKLLTDDGVVFISIDDNEQANLKLLCDEIFYESNVDIMIWRKSGVGRDGKMKNTTTFRKDHEYVIVCFNNENYLNKSYEKPIWENEYGNPDNDPRGAYKPGSISRKEEASNPNHEKYYTVISPTGKTFTRQFDVPKEEFERLDADNRIYWGVNGDAVPAIKIFQDEKREVTTSSYIIERKDYISDTTIEEQNSTTTKGSKELESLLGIEDIGSEMRPKPTELIIKFLQIGTNNDDVVLDFFAGTSTVADSCMQINSEQNKKNLKYIMVQLDEPTKENSISKNNGYNSIDEISRKRIELAGKKIKEETNADVDYGFKHYYVKSTEVKTINKIEEFNPDVAFIGNEDMIREFDNDKSKGEDVILTTWLVDDGYKLDIKPETKDICGYKAYYVDNSTLYLISQGWNTEQTKELLNLVGNNKFNLKTIIIYGYSFNFESLNELKTNIKQNLDKTANIEIRY